MADVARLAGVSSQTVSRVSNGSPDVIESTRRQVLAAMNELGYRPNSAARALKRGSSAPSASSLFIALHARATCARWRPSPLHAARQGYAITLIPVDGPDPGRGAGRVLPAGRTRRRRRHRHHGGPPPRRGDRDAAARTCRSSSSTPTPASSTAWWTPTRPTAPARPSGTCSTSATGRSGTSPAPKSPSPPNAAPPPGARTLTAAGAAVPPVLRGDWSADSGYRGRAPARRRTRLHGGVRRQRPDGPRPAAGLPREGPKQSPRTSAWSASTTSPKPPPTLPR